MIGILPLHLTSYELRRLNDELKQLSSTAAILIRDHLLYDIDIEYMPEIYSADILFQEQMDLDLDYYDVLRSAVTELLKNKQITVLNDLIDPGTIPNEYNIDSRSRMRDIMDTLYILNMENGELNPYEVSILSGPILNRGGSGQIVQCKYMDEYPLLIKKIADCDPPAESLYHEYLVGLAVNRLRFDIPNYMYTYGIIDDVQSVRIGSNVYFCNKKSGQIHLCIEHIQNATTLDCFSIARGGHIVVNGQLHNYTRVEVLRLIIFQLLCAILYAYDTIGFLHRDMNCGNILIVRLPCIMAIPIMVPVSYERTDCTNTRRVKVHFERRWILTDILVVIVDFGLSTVDSKYVNTNYKYRQFISPESIYQSHEIMSGPENDIAILLRNIYTSVLSESTNDAISQDILRILYRMYTGNTASEEHIDPKIYEEYNMNIHSCYRYNLTHPSVEYDPYGAVIEYCNRYSDIILSEDPSEYPNILSKSADSEHILTTINSPHTYYWYSKYSEELPNLIVDISAIESNTVYKTNILLPNIFTNSETNMQIIANIVRNSKKHDYAILLLLAMYRYIKYFHDKSLTLDILPIQYTKPNDILECIREFIKNNSLSLDPTVTEYLNSM